MGKGRLEFLKKPCAKILLLILQIAIIVASGILANDVWYSIVISIVGIIFNMLVSFNISYGFLFGFVYAIINGIYAYYSKIYATFGFMIIMQAPMALYSFYSWFKNKKSGQAETQLKTMRKKSVFLLCVFMVCIGVASYFLLNSLNSENIIPDTIFFAFSVTACVLLALRYKIAYIITLFSGAGGVVLYSVQMFSSGRGLSIAVFYGLVTVNSIIGVINNYLKKQSDTTGELSN